MSAMDVVYDVLKSISQRNVEAIGNAHLALDAATSHAEIKATVMDLDQRWRDGDIQVSEHEWGDLVAVARKNIQRVKETKS